jgi:hypothetical protein
VELRTDPRNCGSCGNACGPGAACVDGACRCADTIVSFAADVQPIFSAACNASGCHTGARPKEGLSLEVGEAYASLVGAPASQCSERLLVKPGDPAGSYLVQKLMGTQLCSGSQMPKAGQGLPDAEFETISNWICQGAPEN